MEERVRKGRRSKKFLLRKNLLEICRGICGAKESTRPSRHFVRNALERSSFLCILHDLEQLAFTTICSFLSRSRERITVYVVS